MGTKCAIIYANLFMSHFEETHIYNLIQRNCPFYKRFIDDIFLLWNGTLDELTTFLEEINRLHPTIKFDAKYSTSSIEFLDTKVYKFTDGKLHTTLYTKPTDRQSYLHNKSYHPTSCKRSIAYSQALRIKRICSEPSEFEKHTTTLSKKLVDREYDQRMINHQINKARQSDRKKQLEPKDKSIKTNKVLAITYNKNLPNLKKAIDNNWHILSINPEIAPTFQQKPILAFRRNPNLGQLLFKHKLRNNMPIVKKVKKIGRCSPCLSRKNNKCCKQMVDTYFVTNRKTGTKFHIFHHLNCKSNNVIYLIECSLCNFKPYIGKSETASNPRINNHRSDSRKEDSITVDQHFSTNGHNFEKHAKITLIEKVENTSHILKK